MDSNEDAPLIKMPKNGTRVTIILVLVQFGIAFANLYLSNGYVPKVAYEKDSSIASQKREDINLELRGIAIELRGIKDHMQGDERQDKKLDDLESRMREQERRK